MSPEQAEGEQRRPGIRHLLAGAHSVRVLGRGEPGPPGHPGADRAGDGRAAPLARRVPPRPSAPLCAAIDRCLEPDPDDRPALTELRHDARGRDPEPRLRLRGAGARREGRPPRRLGWRPARAGRPRRGARVVWSSSPAPRASPARALIVALLGFPALRSPRPRAGRPARAGRRAGRALGGRRLPGARRRARTHPLVALRPRRDRLVLAADARARRSGSPHRPGWSSRPRRLGRLVRRRFRRARDPTARAQAAAGHGGLRHRRGGARAGSSQAATWRWRRSAPGLGGGDDGRPAPGRRRRACSGPRS